MRAAALVASLVLLAACGAREEFAPEYRETFLSACVAEGGAAATCECVWGKVESQMTRAELDALGAAERMGEEHPAKQRLIDFTRECAA